MGCGPSFYYDSILTSEFLRYAEGIEACMSGFLALVINIP
jgi:hypothetical protein